MVKRSRKTQNSQSKPQEFVIVAFTEDIEQAKDYEAMLKINYIPVILNDQYEQSTGGNGIAVMVPKDYLDEAHVIVAPEDTYQDFYDISSEDEDDSEFLQRSF